jgi:hypothetical protein
VYVVGFVSDGEGRQCCGRHRPLLAPQGGLVPGVVERTLRDWPSHVQTSFKRKLLHFALHLEINVWLSVFIADLMDEPAIVAVPQAALAPASVCCTASAPQVGKVLVCRAAEADPLTLSTWFLGVRVGQR